MTSVVIDVNAFQRRAQKLITNFKNHAEEFGDADVLLITAGTGNQEMANQRVASLQLWLLGYEFSDTVFIVTKDEKFVIVTSTKKAAYLEGIENSSINLTMICRTKEENKIGETIELIKSFAAAKIGVFIKEKAVGKFAAEWNGALEKETFQYVDASFGLSSCMLTKEPGEIKDIEIASKISTAIMQHYFLEEMGSIIDDDRKVSHASLSSSIEAILGKDVVKFGKKLRFPPEADLDLLEFSYLPVIQSGGDYDFIPTVESNNRTLHAGTILCTISMRYKSYSCSLARTFLINPSKLQEKHYDFLLEVYHHTLSFIRPGVLCKDVYQRAFMYVKEKRPELEPHFVKSLGAGIGIEHREKLLTLSPKNTFAIPAHCVLSFTLGFHNLKNESATDERAKVYSLLLSDTLVVEPEKTICFTSKCNMDATNICYYFEDEEEEKNGKEEGEEEKKKKNQKNHHEKAIKSSSDRMNKTKTDGAEKVSSAGKPSKSSGAMANTVGPMDVDPKRPERRKASAILQTKTRYEDHEQSAEVKRQEHQKNLARQRQEDGLRRFTAMGEKSQKEDQRVFRKFESYKNMNTVPKDAGLQIYVDHRNESILLPMFGYTVPFHIATLKNLSKNDEGEYVYIRLNFVTPGQTIGRKEEMPAEIDNDQLSLVKTLTYRSNDTSRMTEIYRQISELKKQSLKAEAERKDKADIVEQDQLMEMKKNRPITLQDVYARPTLDGKRLPGDLQIHVNGLRYVSRVKSENRIDVLYSNLRHLFFQPCDKELIVLIHLHLKNPIMIGKKKTKDLQFYKEAIDVSFDETGNRRRRQNYGDEDELQQEQEEKRRRLRLNKEFKDFGEQIAESYEARLDLDIPYRDLAFDGVPFRSNVLLQPTSDCLVHLTDPPFLVITLSDLELVHLERVQFGLKNFDMVFIFSDFSRTPVHINSIPMKELEHVKDWLDSMNVMFTEGPATLNWSAVMKNINEDPESFFRDGGWSFLRESSDNESEESDDSGSVFEVDSEELDTESSDYSSDYSEPESEMSESEFDEDEEDESEYDD